MVHDCLDENTLAIRDIDPFKVFIEGLVGSCPIEFDDLPDKGLQGFEIVGGLVFFKGTNFLPEYALKLLDVILIQRLVHVQLYYDGIIRIVMEILLGTSAIIGKTSIILYGVRNFLLNNGIINIGLIFLLRLIEILDKASQFGTNYFHERNIGLLYNIGIDYTLEKIYLFADLRAGGDTQQQTNFLLQIGFEGRI